MTRLYLVSCAQTILDAEGVFPRSSLHRLSREGIKHARLLSKRLEVKAIDSFYSSPWEGAIQTASILAARHRTGVIRIRDLQEMHYGKWAGKAVEELKESDPESLITWQFQPHLHRMPGGETLEQVQDRVVRALERILSTDKSNGVCVVTHPVPVKAAMCYLRNDDLSLVWLTARQESTALNIIDFENDEAQVVQVGSIEHLSDKVTV